MGELRFACDAMLGRLARWLRFAGFDVSFDPALSGSRRWRARRGPRGAGCSPATAASRRSPARGWCSCAAPAVAAQVRELRERLPLAVEPARFLTRCSRCNGALEEVARETVRDRVPPYVAAHAPRFVSCNRCGRLYWPGTHAARIARQLEAWFGA